MNQANWNCIKGKLEEEDNNIFKNIDKTTLSDYDKRKTIFNYLCDITEYDYLLYLDMLLKQAKSKEDIDNFLKECNITDSDTINYYYNRFDNKDITKKRDSIEELLTMIEKHKGICNSISQYYKLLLEYNGIYSVCVICDNMSYKNHQITMVYDKDSNSYSFDDITTAVISKNLKDSCFDYDIDSAKKINQGERPVGYLSGITMKDYLGFGILLRTEVINYYVGKENDDSYLQYGLESNGNIALPNNIISKKRLGEENENTNRHKKSR